MKLLKPVQPNFINALLITSISAFSVSAFAAHHGDSEEKMADKAVISSELTSKEIVIEAKEELSADELKIKMDDEKAKAEMKKMMAKDAKAEPEKK